MKNLLISLTICVFFYTNNLNAQVSTSGLTEEQKAQLALQAAQMKKQNDSGSAVAEISKFSPEKLNEWVELGKNAGLAVAAMAKELGVASDKFLESNTGKIAAALIIWKVVGKDMVGIVGGTIAWVILVNIILWSFRYFHMKKKMTNKKEGTTEYVNRYEFNTSDARVGSVWAHGIAFFTTTLVCGFIIF